jgi:hypothetical protein
MQWAMSLAHDLSQLDLNLLKALDALLTHGHVTRAALALGLTGHQSAAYSDNTAPPRQDQPAPVPRAVGAPQRVCGVIARHLLPVACCPCRAIVLAPDKRLTARALHILSRRHGRDQSGVVFITS